MTDCKTEVAPVEVADVAPDLTRTSVAGFLRRGGRGMAAMTVLTTLANAVNYASALVFSRALQPTGFGELTSLLALSVVLAVPLAAAQTIVAERVSVAHASGDWTRIRFLIRYALGHMTVVAICVTALYLACVPAVMAVLDIREPGPALALAPLIFATFISLVTTGALQGMERYAAFGALIFVTASSRLIFGVPWAAAGGGAGGAIAGQALGIMLVTVAVGWRYRMWFNAPGEVAVRRGLLRRLDLVALTASGVFLGFALLSNLDVILARIWLDRHEAGIYAAMANIAKVIIFLPSAIAVLMVPRVARTDSGGTARLGILRLSALLTGGVALICAIPALAAPGLVIDVMFGSDYDAAVSGVLPAVISGTLLAVLSLICFYTVTVRDRLWLWAMLGGVLVQIALIGLYHSSPTEIMWAQASAMAMVLVVNEIVFHPLVLRRSRVA